MAAARTHHIASSVKRRLRGAAFRICVAGLRAGGSAPLPAVFVLAHMRSGSTLLLHVLMSHPQIVGRGEGGAPYREASDLDRLELEARWASGALFRPYRYVAEQINHDHITPNESLLADPRMRLVFLTREPPSAISSIVHLKRDFYRTGTVGEAVDYYLRRLSTLARYAQDLPDHRPALALTYDELVDNTGPTLGRVQRFLELETPFSERYDLQRFTGVRGDPSEHIRAGRIVRDRVSRAVEIPPGALERAWQAYEACQRAMGRFS